MTIKIIAHLRDVVIYEVPGPAGLLAGVEVEAVESLVQGRLHLLHRVHRQPEYVI